MVGDDAGVYSAVSGSLALWPGCPAAQVDEARKLAARGRRFVHYFHLIEECNEMHMKIVLWIMEASHL